MGPPDPNLRPEITLREACRCQQACKGRVGDLAVFGRCGVKNDRKKKFPKCVWVYFGGVVMMFSNGVDAFWALQTPICVLTHLAGGAYEPARGGWGT